MKKCLTNLSYYLSLMVIPRWGRHEEMDMQDTPKAIIYVDGQEFIRCTDEADYNALFRETVEQEGGEVALAVYKPQFGGYLREQLSITASKPANPTH